MARFSSLASKIHDFKHRTKDAFSRLMERKIVKLLSWAILATNFLAWVLGLLLSRRLNDGLAVLHYNVDFGIDLVGEPWRLLALPAFLSIITLADLIFLLAFSRKQSFRFVAMFIAGSLGFISFLVLLTFIALYSINF